MMKKNLIEKAMKLDVFAFRIYSYLLLIFLVLVVPEFNFIRILQIDGVQGKTVIFPVC